MKVKFIFINAFILFFLCITNAYSCVCGVMPSVEGMFEKSDKVFTGRVVDINFINAYEYIAKVEVIGSFKGVKGKYEYVASTTLSRECGYNFVLGHRYLIYAHLISKRLVGANSCGRTQVLQRVSIEDLSILNALWNGKEKQ